MFQREKQTIESLIQYIDNLLPAKAPDDLKLVSPCFLGDVRSELEQIAATQAEFEQLRESLKESQSIAADYKSTIGLAAERVRQWESSYKALQKNYHTILDAYEQTKAELAAYRQAEAEGRIIDVDANGPHRVTLDGKLIGLEYDNMFVPIEWDCDPEAARAAFEKGE